MNTRGLVSPVLIVYSPFVHPLVAALLDALAKEMRVEPSLLLDAVEGRPVPDWFAAALAGAFAPRVTVADFQTGPLTGKHLHSTIDPMEASSSVLRSRSMRLTRGVPETKQIKATQAANITFAEIAKKLTAKLGRSISVASVQAWHKKKGDPLYRRTPDDCATAMEELFNIPRATWPSIIPPK